jgi:microcystin-dependent protein
MHPSTRLAIPIYDETDTPVDIPTAWNNRTAVLDTLVPISSGTLAARPTSSSGTPGIVGRQYITTDQSDSPRIDLDLGTSWVTVASSVRDGDPTVGLPRSLGTGAQQACAGNDVRLFTTGDIKLSAAANPPGGWLLCDGSNVSRTTYAALFAAIGTANGTGDGSTTFGLPDLRSRVPVGAGQGPGLSNRANGVRGGEENHTLSATEMPAHNHGGATGTAATAGMNGANPHAHNPDMTTNPFTGVAGGILFGGPLTHPNYGAFINATDINHSHNIPALSIASAGGSVGHNNMPPFNTVNYFIKT